MLALHLPQLTFLKLGCFLAGGGRGCWKGCAHNNSSNSRASGVSPSGWLRHNAMQCPPAAMYREILQTSTAQLQAPETYRKCETSTEQMSVDAEVHKHPSELQHRKLRQTCLSVPVVVAPIHPGNGWLVPCHVSQACTMLQAARQRKFGPRYFLFTVGSKGVCVCKWRYAARGLVLPGCHMCLFPALSNTWQQHCLTVFECMPQCLLALCIHLHPVEVLRVVQQGHIRCQHCNSTGILQVMLLISQSSSTDGTHAPCVCPHNVVGSCCAKLTCRHLQRLQAKPLQQLQTASINTSNTVAVNERRHQGPSTNHRQERQTQQALPTPWLQNTFQLKNGQLTHNFWQWLRLY